MEIIILIPTVLCLAMYLRYPVQRVFLNLYIPLFALFPMYYYWKVSLLPPIDLADAVLLPLGFGIVVKEMPRWKLTPADLSVAVFAFTAYYADHLAGRQTAAIFGLFQVLCTAVVPYMAGKVLIEQHEARVATVRRILFCTFLASVLSMYEYRMSFNPFTMVWARFFPDESFAWKTQIRWGFGRLAGPYGQSELAGMILLFAFVLALWFGYNKLWEPKFARASWLPLRKSTIVTACILIALLMTQARGPWIGTLLALPIALVGRSRRVMVTAMIVWSFCLFVGSVAYIGFQHYLHSPTTSDAQQTAQYRQLLFDNYFPIAVRGGAWGWGSQVPQALGQSSVDNEYLLVALTQGYVGFAAFSLLAMEVLVRLAWAARFAAGRSDRYFAFSLLGIFAGLLFTISTVFLGNQAYQLFFFLAGWAQALPTRPAERAQLSFEHVYS